MTVRRILKIVALYAGQALRQQVVLGLNYLLQQGPQAHGGDGGLDVVQYVLLHYAVGRPGLVHLGKGAVVPH